MNTSRNKSAKPRLFFKFETFRGIGLPDKTEPELTRPVPV